MKLAASAKAVHEGRRYLRWPLATSFALWMSTLFLACIASGCARGPDPPCSSVSGTRAVRDAVSIWRALPSCEPDLGSHREELACPFVRIRAPVVCSSDGDPLETVDRWIQDAIQRRLLRVGGSPSDLPAIADAFLTAAQGPDAGVGTWYLDVLVAPISEDERRVSLEAVVDVYQGENHGQHWTWLRSFDLATGAPLALEDVIEETARAPLARAAERAFRRIRGLAAEQSLEEAGFEFPAGRFALPDNFAVVEGGLALHFNPYDVAPWVLGPTRIVVPDEAYLPCVPLPTPSTPCSIEGKHCPVPEMCRDSCIPCLVMVCEDGEWSTVEEMPEAPCDQARVDEDSSSRGSPAPRG